MEQFKRAQVIMLPTRSGENIPILKNVNGRGNQLYVPTKNYYYTEIYLKEQQFEPQHLYIISDDEIKEGDWFIDITSNNYGELYQSIGYSTSKGYENWIKSTKGVIKEPITQCKKIIATTDTSLMTTISVPYIGGQPNRKMLDVFKLPQPSQQFIDKYIESYNIGNIITAILVEYDNLVEDRYGAQHLQTENDSQQYLNTCTLISSNVKVNSKDNTITIKKLKDNWNREEVIGLLRGILSTNDIYIARYPDGSVDDVDDKDFNQWITKNL